MVKTNTTINKKPIVSVISITYNQDKYIQEALDGFLAQKTNFPFEVIVADDQSTDRTPEIIKKFEKAHPNIIKPILRSKNLGVQKNCIDAFKHAKGKYIAFCEGDDYWTDPKKLQKQVDLMEANPRYALCFHPVKVFFENNEEQEYIYPPQTNKAQFTLKNLLKQNYIQSNSVLYRRREYGELPEDVMPLDWYLHLYHAQFGKIGFINNTMSAYRRQNTGIWWNSYKNINMLWKKHGVGHISLYVELLKLYGNTPEYMAIIYDNIANLLAELVTVDNELLTQVLEKFPQITEEVVAHQSQLLSKQKEELQKQEKKSQKQQQEIEQLQQSKKRINHIIEQQQQEIEMIKSLKAVKLRNIIAKLAGKKPV